MGRRFNGYHCNHSVHHCRLDKLGNHAIIVDMKYAIVQPHYGMGTIVALCQTQPAALAPLIVVELRGYYRAELGMDCPYERCPGGYREAIVDTTGT